jgi:AcrR family transcriptional regulator
MEDQITRDRVLSFIEGRIGSERVIRMSVDQITASLGMSKKTFYRVFPTKEAMLEALIERILTKVGREIDRIIDGDLSFVEKTQALMTFLGRSYQQLAVPLSRDLFRLLPHVWERVDQFRQRKIQRSLEHLIEQGASEGFIRRDLDRPIFIMAYLAVVRQIVTPDVLSELPLTGREVISQLVSIFFEGAMTQEGRQKFHHRLEQSHST